MNPLIYSLYQDEFGNNVFIMREDLVPFSFGGNKYRIALEFIRDMNVKGKNCIIGYGNARSNLSRALANLCFKNNIECHIVSPSDEDESVIHTFNEKFSILCNAKFHKCKKTEVSATVERVIKECKDKGLDPYYIYGDITGRGNESTPVNAYYEVYNVINAFERDNSIKFDYIFLPVGTGMTQAGLLCAIESCKKDTKVVGISIARNSRTETNVLKTFVDAYNREKKLSLIDSSKIIVDDSYLAGGYGVYTAEIERTINKMFIKFGLPLDPVYSGKAFTGMEDYLKNKLRNNNVLFIHTGGTPLFFDYMQNYKEAIPLSECFDSSKLINFLNKIDDTLPVSLSSRVNISEYANKVINNGTVLTVEIDDRIIAASLFYCNDFKSKQGYLSLIATIPECQCMGLGNKLLMETINFCKRASMKTIALDVEKKNFNAIIMYLKNGFVIEEIESKIHMVKKVI